MMELEEDSRPPDKKPESGAAEEKSAEEIGVMNSSAKKTRVMENSAEGKAKEANEADEATDFLAAKKDAADQTAGSKATVIKEAAVEKATDSSAEKKGATEEADSSHTNDRVSNDASVKVATGKVATQKLAAWKHAFKKPTKIDRKSLEIFLYAAKETLDEKKICTEEEKAVIEGKKDAAEEKVAAVIEAASETEKAAEYVPSRTFELNFGRPPTSSMIKVTQRRHTVNVKKGEIKAGEEGCNITEGSLRVARDVMNTMGDNWNPEVDVKPKADFEPDCNVLCV